MTDYTIHFSSIVGNLRLFADEDDPLLYQYISSKSEYENRSYDSSLRTLGICCEILSERTWKQAGIDKDLPDQAGARIEGLRNNEMGPATLIGELLGPIWWLRCEVAHAGGYETEKKEAAVAHHLFRVAADTYRESYTET